jgi:hypothetical protein
MTLRKDVGSTINYTLISIYIYIYIFIYVQTYNFKWDEVSLKYYRE